MTTTVATPEVDAGRRKSATGRSRAENSLGLKLVAPAVVLMLLVTAYPMFRAIYLSLFHYRATAPDDREFVGIQNYLTVLGDELWWRDIWNTVLIMVITVAIELVIGFAFAMVMHRIIFARGIIRTSILIPYGIITVVSAFTWQFAFSLNNGFVNGWLPFVGDDFNWFGGHWSSLSAIMVSEIWKTTPFMSLLLLAGLSQVSEDMLEAAKVDGATWWQRLFKVILPNMKAAIMVAVLFRALDHDPADEAGDPRRAPVPDARRVPGLRHDLHHDPGRPGHRVGVLPHLSTSHRPVRARDGVGALGAALLVGAADRVPAGEAVQGRSRVGSRGGLR
jgi:multiple sugar transport system permease protein